MLSIILSKREKEEGKERVCEEMEGERRSSIDSAIILLFRRQFENCLAQFFEPIHNNSLIVVLRNLNLISPVYPCSFKLCAMRCTCSIHGENEHIILPIFSAFVANGTLNHGEGKSRKTASTQFSRFPNPSWHASA